MNDEQYGKPKISTLSQRLFDGGIQAPARPGETQKLSLLIFVGQE
jgi:hypothetical protein